MGELTLDEIIRSNREAGFHFFDMDTKRFFGSIVSDRIYPTPDDGGAYLVTSERDHGNPQSVRRYTVRRYEATGTVTTWEGDQHEYAGFGRYATARQAHAAARGAAQRHFAPELVALCYDCHLSLHADSAPGYREGFREGFRDNLDIIGERWPLHVWNYVPDTEPWIGSDPCEGCGDTLQGYRFPNHVMRERRIPTTATTTA